MPLLEFFSRSGPKDVETRAARQKIQHQKCAPRTSGSDERNNMNAVHTVKRRFTFDASDGLPTTVKSPQKLAAEGESEECTRQRCNSATQLFGGSLADSLLMNSYDQL